MAKETCKNNSFIRKEPLGYEWPGAYFIGHEELELVSKVVKAASLFRYYGLDCQHMADRFEKEFAGYTGSRYALAVSSGTAALNVALAALGGAFADTGNHAADLLEYVMDRRIKSVLGIRHNTIYSYKSEDSCAALLDFQEGGFGIVDAYFCCPLRTLRNDLEINGTKGTLHTCDTLQMKTTGKLVVRTEKYTKVFKCPNRDMYAIIFEKFTDAVLHGRKLPVSGEDGLHSQKIIDAIYCSSDTNRKIAIGESICKE